MAPKTKVVISPVIKSRKVKIVDDDEKPEKEMDKTVVENDDIIT